MTELAMVTIARIYLPLMRGWKWPKVNIAGLVGSFGDALELYRKALAMAYLTSLFASSNERDECLPDDELEGRDPRW
jgi:hypothetical protein